MMPNAFTGRVGGSIYDLGVGSGKATMSAKQGTIGPESRARNHYVPRLYLKRWADREGRVCAYRLLVPNAKAPLWKSRSSKGLAYHTHLYTRVIAEGETDQIEKWLGEEFENPAEDAIGKVVSEARMSPGDWTCLARFVAAQDVRTPARLMEMLGRWGNTLPTLVQSTLEESIQEMTEAKRNGTKLVASGPDDSEYLPSRVTTEIQPDAKTSVMKLETVVGRGLYLFALRRLLTQTLQVLEQHRWTILRSPVGLKWMTSDDPVIKLNYHTDRYDFNGGWGSRGTEILLPLSPNHLLYTKIGEKAPRRGTRVSVTEGALMQRMIVEHAHRFVFAVDQDATAPIIRPRIVDVTRYKSEIDQWARWHDEQVEAERELFRGRG